MRFNEVGIPMVPEELRKKVFKTPNAPIASRHLVREARKELENFGLDTSKIKIPNELPEGFLDLIPDIMGEDIEEHFDKMVAEKLNPYKDLISMFYNIEVPKYPDMVMFKPGWTRYQPGEDPMPVFYPEEDIFVFDVETCVVEGGHPVIATAVSASAWYVWVSAAFFNSEKQLIPLGEGKKIVIGHNVVGFDKKHVVESYYLKETGIRYLDTMSLHTTVGGLGTKQRTRSAKYHAGEYDDDPTIDYDRPWLDVTSDSKLSSLASLYCGITMDKELRNMFVTEPLAVIRENFQSLVKYCFKDVLATYKVFKVLYLKYRHKCPNDITLFGQLEMSTVFLPTTKGIWNTFTTNCRTKYYSNVYLVNKQLTDLANQLVEDWENGLIDIEHNPWYSQLDWSISKRAKFLKDKPAWYRELRVPKAEDPETIKITAKSKITPILLNLRWYSYPLCYVEGYKWGYLVPFEDDYSCQAAAKFINSDLQIVESMEEGAICYFYQLPHQDGENKNVGSPFAKQYISDINSGILNSSNSLAKLALELTIENSFWESNQDRVSKQVPLTCKDYPAIEIIIPSFLPIGTVTGRATESLWLCAANPKKNKIGTEIKTTIRSPEGYIFVAADIDSEELILSDLFGMKVSGIFGGTPSSFQTLVGSKEFKTDSHSVTASTIGISRDNAKNLNYSRRYGAGESATVGYLRSFNKMLSMTEAKGLSRTLMKATKGVRINGVWKGGSESAMFNEMENLALSPHDPKTPILERSLPNCLHPYYTPPRSYVPSKVNFFVQASGVDFLHLWLLATSWLADYFSIPYRLTLTIHDESHWLIKKEHSLDFSLIIQIAHLWTWAYVVWKFGFSDLPFNNAWLSGVDIDFTFRKSPDAECLTASNLVPLPGGISKTIYDILAAKLSKIK